MRETSSGDAAAVEHPTVRSLRRAMGRIDAVRGGAFMLLFLWLGELAPRSGLGLRPFISAARI